MLHALLLMREKGAGETTFPMCGYAQKVSAAVGVSGLDYFRYGFPTGTQPTESRV